MLTKKFASRSTKYLAAMILCASFYTMAPQEAAARQWNMTTQAKVQDYIIIQDQRSQRELVMIIWLAPQLIPGTQTGDAGRKMLEDYIVVGVIHADISQYGEFNFRAVADLTLRTMAGKLLPAIPDGDMPPAVVGGVATMKTVFTNALGKMGAGTKWFVFDGSWFNSCEKGGFFVPYAGENYDYPTPAPGC